MPRARNGKGKSRAKPLSKRFKENPITTTKSEVKKLGVWKYPLGLVASGILVAPFADELVNSASKISPSLGSLMSVFTNYGKNIGNRIRA